MMITTAENWKETTVREQQAHHRRVPDGIGGRLLSAFKPIVGQAGLIPFVPRPGPLPRKFHGQSSRDKAEPCPQPSRVNLFTQRNAISSSYSSTGGFPGPRRRGRATTRTRLFPKSSKEPAENGFQSLCSVPEISKETKYEKTADAAPRQTKSWSNWVHTTDSAGSGKRKIPLLQHRRGDPLLLPPPPKLSYRVTAEHIGREKEAALQRINSTLMGKSQAPKVSNTTQPSCSPPLPASGTAPSPSVPTVPCKEAEKREHVMEQDSLGPGALQASAAVTSSLHPGCGRKRSTSAACPSSSEALPGSSLHSTATASGSSLTAVLSPAACKGDLRTITPAVPVPSAGEALFHQKERQEYTQGSPTNGEEPGPWSPRVSERVAAGVGSAFPAVPSTYRTNSPSSPMCVEAPVTSPSSSPRADPGAPYFTSLSIPASAQSDRASASTTDFWVTDMDTTPPRSLSSWGLPLAHGCSFLPLCPGDVTPTPL
ncbi:putative POM121-like protein 1 [Fukomys damarensis]|uniref:Putative POM121-like protein 1 n=1 Tax=Fukomys damarensis TaxID=885580 RepID=A0A091CZT8_FUKDA|nr:putative POM121-like protein 1 [Fukomys damarensis]KFO23753.1 Putative POM121-like protein 1 [Fukomys damarensis]